MIEWTPALSTGVALLDEQHKEIFQWLAELQSAAVDERTLFGVYSLTRLKHYTRAHFSAEEALMKAAGYPDLAHHAAEHAKFRARLDELQLKSIGQDISQDTVEFLTDWLTNHITRTDMAYVPCLKKVN
jgi:hemerythrin-like metal-binding protein